MKRLTATVHAAVAAAFFFTTSDALAEGHLSGFGEKGQLVLSVDRLVPVVNYSHRSTTATAPNGDTVTTSNSGTGISLLFGTDLTNFENNAVLPPNVHTIPRIAFDFSVTRSLTVGAGIGFGFGLGGTNKVTTQTGSTNASASSDAPTLTAIGISPRVGYVLGLTDSIGFWPRAGLSFYSASGSTSSTNGQNVTSTTKVTYTQFALDLDPQFVFVPFEHFFINAGPIVNIPLGGSATTTTTSGSTTASKSNDASAFNLGVNAGLGGWFNVF